MINDLARKLKATKKSVLQNFFLFYCQFFLKSKITKYIYKNKKIDNYLNLDYLLA